MIKFKGVVVAVLAGATMFSGACLNWQQIALETAIYAGTEFLLDNANVIDLFPDGPGTDGG